MTHGSLFTGGGGLDLGFELAGFATIGQCENDRFANEVLEHHWPDVPRHEDINDFDGREWEGVDVITGGFPCQDVSVSGRREGLAGTRSGLFFQMCRVVEEARPRAVIWENVAGLLSQSDGNAMRTVCAELASLGYFGAWRLLDSAFFGVPQSRRRVFGAFVREDCGGWACGCSILFDAGSSGGSVGPPRKAKKPIADGTGRCIVGTVSNKWHKQSGGPSGDERYNMTTDPLVPGFKFAHECVECPDCGEPWCEDCEMHYAGCHCVGPSNLEDYIEENNTRVRRLTPEECERAQGFPTGFTAMLSDTQRYKVIGNAVAVPVAYWLALRTKMALEAG